MLNLKTILKHKTWLLFLLTCLFFHVLKAQDQQPKRVLFVGNSFIYFFNLPQVVSAMAKSEGSEIITRQSTVGGSSLEDHWEKRKGTKTMELLASQKWDYVVFNNHSLSAIDTPESFMTYGKKFAAKVKKLGAVPVFMITWGYKSNPLIQEPITKAYLKLIAETDAEFVPAGPLMAASRRARPDLNLFQDDKHPSSNGTYLIGLSFYKFFEKKSTKNIPSRLTTYDKDGELLYLIFMNQQDTDYLQNLVDGFDFINPIK